jgi:hypothetical protein
MFFTKPIRSIVNIDLSFIKIFLKLTRITIKFRGGYDLNRLFKHNIIIKSYLNVPVIIFCFFNHGLGP